MISDEELAKRQQQKTILVDQAVAFYHDVTPNVLPLDDRRARLLACAIFFNLTTEEAALLNDQTQERKGGDNS